MLSIALPLLGYAAMQRITSASLPTPIYIKYHSDTTRKKKQAKTIAYDHGAN